MKLNEVYGNRQSFGMKIPHTNALGETIRFWRINGASQKDIQRILHKIKVVLPDTFELHADKYNSVNMKSGSLKCNIIFNNTEKSSFSSDLAPYTFIKNLKKHARKFKEEMIDRKGHRAVIGKGVY